MILLEHPLQSMSTEEQHVGLFSPDQMSCPPALALHQEQPGVRQMGTGSKWLPKPSFLMTAVVNEARRWVKAPYWWLTELQPHPTQG